MLHLDVSGGVSKVLLHSCCAPCSGAVVECLLQNGIRPVVFFSNSNITPYEEYVRRCTELERYCRFLNVEMIEDEYDHEAWRKFVLASGSGLADSPERGPRCLECFKFRLLRAARAASSYGLKVLTTTLASSRWKSLEQVDVAGLWAVGRQNRVSPCPLGVQGDGFEHREVLWWNQNWRRGGLQPRRSEIIKEQNFYNQDWCGCEFSRRAGTQTAENK